MRLYIDMIKDKYPNHWSIPENGVHKKGKKKLNDKTLAKLISEMFGCNCTELDVFMTKDKHKERAKIFKACKSNPEDMLEMINYYRDDDTRIMPKRRIVRTYKGMQTPTLEILKYLIAKGDISVK